MNHYIYTLLFGLIILCICIIIPILFMKTIKLLKIPYWIFLLISFIMFIFVFIYRFENIYGDIIFNLMGLIIASFFLLLGIYLK